MVFYLIEDMDFNDVVCVYVEGIVILVKFYFVGVIINLVLGVWDFDKVCFVLEKMVEIGMFLCVYGEVIDSEIDIFDCEVVFIDCILYLICKKVFGLKVVMEYVIM